MNKTLPKIHQSKEELEHLIRSEKKPRRKERLQMLYLLKTRQASSREAAGATLGKHRNTISRWCDRYERGGLEHLLEVYEPTGQAGQCTLPEHVYQALARKLEEPEGFSGYMHALGWLRAEFNIEIQYETLRKIIRTNFAAKLKRPRPSHVKKTRIRSWPSPRSSMRS